MKTIVLIGSGNVATQLARNIYERPEVASHFQVIQVYSPNESHAQALANLIACEAISSLPLMRTDADLYLFSVKDAALEDVINHIPANNGLWIHTSGSMPMEILATRTQRYGVLYPLQTFSKERPLSLREVPLFLECHREEDLAELHSFANLLSDQVRTLDSDQRRTLHLSAVFACNFANHLYALAAHLLEEKQLPFDLLLPLIQETTAKLSQLPPREAQTGPAIRFDTNIIHKHLAMLHQHPRMQQIYEIMSESIYNMYKE